MPAYCRDGALVCLNYSQIVHIGADLVRFQIKSAFKHIACLIGVSFVGDLLRTILEMTTNTVGTAVLK